MTVRWTQGRLSMQEQPQIPFGNDNQKATTNKGRLQEQVATYCTVRA